MKQPQHTTTTLTHLRRIFKSQQLSDWRKHWITSKHGKQYVNNSNKHWPKLKLATSYTNTSRHTVFQLLSLRTGHGFFKSYLKKIKAKDITTSKCNCGHPNQTVDHLLLYCPIYQRQRKKMLKRVGSTRVKRWDLLYNQRNIPHTLEFLQSIGIAGHNWYSAGQQLTTETHP